MDTFNINDIEDSKVTFTFTYMDKKITIEDDDLDLEEIGKIIEILSKEEEN